MVEKEMDIIKIAKRLRYHDLALKQSILKPIDRRHNIKNAKKYMLDIDSDLEDEVEIG